MSTYLEHSVESERQYEAKRAEARTKFGRAFATDKGSDYQPHETPYLTRWLKGEVRFDQEQTQ